MKQSTTDGRLDRIKIFEVTHPFHPLYKKKYKAVTIRQNWGVNRVYYYNSKKQLTSIPTAWTSLKPRDPYCILAAERSDFRFADLIELVQLIKKIKQNKEDNCDVV